MSFRFDFEIGLAVWLLIICFCVLRGISRSRRLKERHLLLHERSTFLQEDCMIFPLAEVNHIFFHRFLLDLSFPSGDL